MREIWFALATILPLAAPPALAQTAAAPPAAAPVSAPGDPLAVTADDRILGTAEAPITIVEYGSLTCPHCAAFADEVLPKLQQKWLDSGKARLVFRAFPRDEADLHAFTVALCAPSDRFFPFIDALFGTQQQWALSSNLKAALGHIALLGGMNTTTFDTCFDDKSVQDRLLAGRLVAAQQLGVDSTPTFFINGKKYTGAPTVEGIESVLSKMTGS